MWWSLTFLRLSVAEKTHNQVFRVLQVLPGPRLVKIAIFSLKILGLRFCLKFANRFILGSLSMWWSFIFFRLSLAEKTHNEAFRVLQFLPGPRLRKIAIFSLKIFGLRFCLKSSHRLIFGSSSMWWSFKFFRLSIAEKTVNEAFRVLQFLPAPRPGKIAIFSEKTFGLWFWLKSSHRLILGP